MRDAADNVVIICSIENIDPMGVHTGDSITVAPGADAHRPQYQELRDAGHGVIRADRRRHRRLQRAVRRQPGDRRGRRHRDEPARLALARRWPPRPPASRSPRSPPSWPSATRSTRSPTTSPRRRRPASSRRSTTCVVKMPRWAFEKFPGPTRELTTHMKSVGEAMAIGRTFKEAFLKAMRSRELDSRRPARRASRARAGARGAHLRALRAHPAGLPPRHERRRGPRAHRRAACFLAELRDIVELEHEVRAAPARSTPTCCGA